MIQKLAKNIKVNNFSESKTKKEFNPKLKTKQELKKSSFL